MLIDRPVMAQVIQGLHGGLLFNLAFAAVSAAVAAGLSGYRRAPRWLVWASAGVLAVGFAAGDGLHAVAAGGGMFRVAVGCLVALVIGYVVPAVAGAYVGRQVHKGTGYLSAAVVALTLVTALSALAHPVAAAVGRLG